MTLAERTRLTINADAIVTWADVQRFIPFYWKSGKKLDAIAARKWHQELGTVVQNSGKNPMWLLEFMVSADSALEMLRKRSKRPFLLAAHTLEHPNHEWFNDRGTGAAQVIGFRDMDEAREAFGAAQMFVHHLLEVDAPMKQELLRVLDEFD